MIDLLSNPRHCRRLSHTRALVALVGVVSAFFVATAVPASAATTGPNGPGAAVNVTGIGTVAWTSPANSLTSNNLYAGVGLANTTSNYLRLTNFGLVVPAGSTINGVSVAVERSASGSSGDIRDASVKLVKASVIAGTEHANAIKWPITDTVVSYGSTSDLWGTTLTQADVTNAGFGVVIAAKNLNSVGTFARVDSVTITVTYTTGGGSGPPVNTAPPTISGTAQSGQTLAASPGTWTGAAPITYAYQWQRCNSAGASCVNIAGATNTSFLVSAPDVGNRLRVQVTGTNGSGSAVAFSTVTAIVTAPAATWTATGYTSTVIANPANAPYTAWTGAWINPVDGSLWAAWTQSGGSLGTGMPQWARDRYGAKYPGLDRDHWQLTNTRQYMRSVDHGVTWTAVYPHAGVPDTLITPVDGAPTANSMSGCSSTGTTSGSGCSILLPHAYTPQADFQLADGTIIRRVNGEDMPYNWGVRGTAFLQRLAPNGAAWSAPQYLLDPNTYTYQISRIRELKDGRLIALGQRWDTPAGTRTDTTPVRHLLMVSSNAGATWAEALTIGSGVTPPKVDEWDVAETANGNLIAVFRTINPARHQALLVKSGSTWVMTNVLATPFGHSGHPELLATAEGPILYMATNDVNQVRGIWYLSNSGAEAGSNGWQLLPFATGGANCIPVAGKFNCSTPYYPRSIQDPGDGSIVIVASGGADQPYPPPTNQYINVQRFRLTSP